MIFGYAFGGLFGEFRAKNIHTKYLGRNQWALSWEAQTQPQPAAYIISIDGTHYDTVFDKTSMIVKGIRNRNPDIQILQIAKDQYDAGTFPSGFLQPTTPTDGLITFDPPASVTDVKFYRVYWDIGTGTVLFGAANLLKDEIPEDGSSSYSVETGEVASGTYKIVVRSVDFANNEETNTDEKTVVLSKLPGVAGSLTITYDGGTNKVTITWVDPSDIGAGNVTIFDNAGSTTSLFPDYAAAGDVVAAGVQTFLSAVLTAGTWVFGLRVNDGTNTELNTSVTVRVRLDAALAEIASPPSRPVLTSELAAAGTVTLRAYYDPSIGDTEPDTIEFYTNDGAGGAVDYTSAIDDASIVKRGRLWVAEFTTIVYGETARIFGARAKTTGGVLSDDAAEITLTPDSTAPPQPLNVAIVAGRP